MRTLGPISDPGFVQPAYTRFDRFWLQFIKDERDLPFIYLTLRIVAVLMPMAVLLYMPFLTGWAWGVVAVLYFYLNNLVFKGPFGLMLHCTSHRPLFKPEYKNAYYFWTWVMAPLFGNTPETYYSHHLGMHHAENNVAPDESTTMPYQRDSVRSFLAYFLDFFFFGVLELLAYLRRKNRMKLLYRALLGELSFYALCIGLSFVNFPATVVVFILPFFMFRLITMLGNWTQHAFVCPTEPLNPYKNSITCINVKYNHKCWNDGYHISHHYRPGLHWTEHPAFFLKTVDKYAQNKAIVFDRLDFLGVFYNLMRKRYDVLASHVVNINGAFSSQEEIEALLRHRTQRIKDEPTIVMQPAAAVS
ncbi:fatty acid desaturase family protein [Rudanella lutea]|uniref:fatty acid desaturase family protein n=1 Tax=Rudanella lutea TaxID=451374 RepID=UPI00035E2FE6|nr:fatty acid desaturase [Rudanella lutea]